MKKTTPTLNSSLDIGPISVNIFERVFFVSYDEAKFTGYTTFVRINQANASIQIETGTPNFIQSIIEISKP